jgi:hypothetical protein
MLFLPFYQVSEQGLGYRKESKKANENKKLEEIGISPHIQDTVAGLVIDFNGA